VEKNKWTCIACMDRKARDWKNILRHEKSVEHARTVAIRLRQIEGSFPDSPGSTDTETTAPALQGLLLALANRQEDAIEDGDAQNISETTDGEESDEALNISMLSTSLLGWLDSDQHSDVGVASNLDLEGRDQGLVHLPYTSVPH
jgi:hypothetical protein